MPIPSPLLDDRGFEDMLAEAKALIQRADCGWTDLSPGDPGTVLLEAFTYLTSILLYRVNRVPEKVYVELLRLVGVKMAPPTAARALLRFSVAKPQDSDLVLPAGTRVTIGRVTGSGSPPPVFTTVQPATLLAGQTSVEGVLACHCQPVQGELAGVGTGLPRQSVQAAHAPIVAPMSDRLDLLVGVEATPDELDERAPAVSCDGRSFRLWREAEYFGEHGPDAFSYVVDRLAGRIDFAPAVQAVRDDGSLEPRAATLARVPAPGRQIRLWYRTGGGQSGNLAAHTLVVMRDAVRGVQVTNPEPATGGTDAETLANALLRGPQEMHSLRRAVNARDFETLALRASGTAARAKAFAKAQLWRHAPPGTVEVLLVPRLGMESERGHGRVTVQALQALETEDARTQIRDQLELRRPLGITCLVHWVRYKEVSVCARVVVHRGEDPQAVRERVAARLHEMVNPLPSSPSRRGWRFGEPLRASHVYDVALGEPGVSYVDRVRLRVGEVPDQNVLALAIDPFQPATWYAGSGAILFRSLNGGDGWEAAGRFPNQTVQTVAPHPARPGLLALGTRLTDGSAQVHVSWDCGESWPAEARTSFAFAVQGLAWQLRDAVPVLLIATAKGLYEWSMLPASTPVQLTVDAAQPALGYYAVAAFVDGRGGSNVVVAAMQSGGVYLSRMGGRSETFTRILDPGEDVRVLSAERAGMRSFLWAGITIAGNEQGKGALRWELPSSPQQMQSPDGWRAMSVHWKGGSCRVLAFAGGMVYAGTHFAGLAVLDPAHADPGWVTSHLQCGLPMRGADRLFTPVPALAVAEPGGPVMAGGERGVFRSRDQGAVFESASRREFPDKVALPPSWLFCSGTHEIEAVNADDAERD
jgi:hypothetical protein